MMTTERRSKRENTSRSPYCAGLEWSQGSLNDSSYRAFCKFAGKLFDCHPPSVLLKEVAALIEAAGDAPDQGKLVGQFRDAIAFVAHERAAEAVGSHRIGSPRGFRADDKWPAPDHALIESIAQKHAKHTLPWWQSISAPASTPGDVLPTLFPAGSPVCFGPRKDVHLVRAMDDMLLDEIAPSVQFIVPNPAREGFTIPPGKRSPKCDENFPLRRFLIVEFDRKRIDPESKRIDPESKRIDPESKRIDPESKRIDPESKRAISEILDLQAALHAHLAELWKAIALLVFSGNESLHAWFPCAGVPEERVIAFLRYACRLGADHALSSPCQFTRMPFGLHANGARQTVHYFNR